MRLWISAEKSGAKEEERLPHKGAPLFPTSLNTLHRRTQEQLLIVTSIKVCAKTEQDPPVCVFRIANNRLTNKCPSPLYVNQWLKRQKLRHAEYNNLNEFR